MARKLTRFGIAAAVLVATGAGIAIQRLRPTEDLAVSTPSPVTISSRTPTPAQRASVSKANPRNGETREEWHELLRGVRALDDTDQAGLDRLYARTAELVRRRGPELLADLERSMDKLVAASLEESFFAFSSWIRESEAPVEIMNALWNYSPPSEASPTNHHPAQTTAVKYRRIEAFGLSELRKRSERGELVMEPSARAVLVETLVARAKAEKSLDVAIEICRLLLALNEKAAIDAALAARKERDRKLVMDVITNYATLPDGEAPCRSCTQSTEN